MKLSVNKANLSGLRAKNRDTIQQVLISKFAFRPVKLSALSRNRPKEDLSLSPWVGNWTDPENLVGS